MNASRILKTVIVVLATMFAVSACSEAEQRTGHPTGILVAFTAGAPAAAAAEAAGAEDNVLDALPAAQAAEIRGIVEDAGVGIASSHPRANGAILIMCDAPMSQSEADKVVELLHGVVDVDYVEVEAIAQTK